jgi:hypothetical protein
MSAPKQKKTFRDPELMVYGDIRRITQATQPVGMGDGGMGGLTKTA